MSNPLIFFSDVHLGAPLLADDRIREQKVIAFLEYAQQLQARIFIVGDLFEFWFEYKEAIPRQNFAVLATMYKLIQNGICIHYLAGNHDLWLGSFLEKEIGVHIHRNEAELCINGQNIYVTHGDGAAKSDSRYRFLKRILCSRTNIKLYRLLHPDLGIPLAKRASQVSRDKGNNPHHWASEYREFAEDRFEEGHDIVIMGHTHYPLHSHTNGHHFINLGDWITHYSYCLIKDNEISLRQWPSMELLHQSDTSNSHSA